MGNSGNDQSIVKLWGHDFVKAKYGLDETQVVSFVNELISQRNTFLQRREHLSSLTKLAERMVAEANNMATQIKDEAIERANAEATMILAKAEEQAQQMIEEKRAEVIAMANRKAEAITANAQQEIELLLEEKTRSSQTELKDTGKSLYGQFLLQLEDLQQQVRVLEIDFEHTLSQKMKQFDLNVERELSSQLTIPMQQENNVILNADVVVNTQPEYSMLADAGVQGQTLTQPGNSGQGKTVPVAAENEEVIDYQGEVELELLPPVDIQQIIGIMRYLDSLPEVETTELIPIADTPRIKVFLNEPVPLMEILRTLPEVSQLKEVTGKEAASFADIPQSTCRQIQIRLSTDRILAEAKEVLTGETSNTQPTGPHSNLK